MALDRIRRTDLVLLVVKAELAALISWRLDRD